MVEAEVHEERPRFTSASIYNHPSGLLSFWYPMEWLLQAAPSPLPDVYLWPDPCDEATHIAIAVRDLEAPLTVEERPVIWEGVREGLAQLPDCAVESLVELNQDGRWAIEWVCTFAARRRRCQRRSRLFFSDRYQYSVVCQGTTQERYAYWQGMFEFILLTVGTAPFSLQGDGPGGYSPAQHARRSPRGRAVERVERRKGGHVT